MFRLMFESEGPRLRVAIPGWLIPNELVGRCIELGWLMVTDTQKGWEWRGPPKLFRM